MKAKKPRLFLLENVPNLRTINNGEPFQFILKCLEALGYKINYKILSGKDFGVPQNRRRLYIVGSLDHSRNFQFPKSTNIPTSIADILEKDVNASYVISDHLWNYFKNRALLKTNSGFGKFNVYSGKEKYTCTLLASYKPHCSRILIGMPSGNPRRITERECARLQGFPESFVLAQVSSGQAYKQLGNSVCVPVIKAIAEQIKNVFIKGADQ